MNENESEKQLPEASTSSTISTEKDSASQTSIDTAKPTTSGSATSVTAPEENERKISSDILETTPESGPVEETKQKSEETLKDGVTSDDNGTFTIDDVVDKAGYGIFQKYLTFLAGLGWLADAFEIIILSIIGDMIACDWEITRWQNAVMTSIVFLGMSFGAPIFGNFADRYGRKTSLAISMLLLFIFGAASAAAPSYIWMIVLRGLMGFALGGIAQGVTLCCEYYPAKVRGRAGFYLSFYWAFGTLAVILSAWIIMRYLDDWRVFVFVASIPALIVFLVMKWYPESARYYLVSDQNDKAMNVLKRLVRMNKSEMPPGRLVMINAGEQRGKMMDLLKPTLLRSTLQFWYIWWAVAMLYYGIALVTPLIVTHGSLLERLIFFALSVEFCSRKIFLGATIIINSFLVLLLMLEIKPRLALLLILFAARALVAGVFQLLFIMTTEAFPTTLRASAMGTGSGWARIGGVIIPFVAQVVVIARPVAAISFLFFIGLLAGVSALLLPMETRGVHMQEVIAH